MYVRIASTMQVVHKLVGFVVFYSLRKGTAFLGNMQEVVLFFYFLTLIAVFLLTLIAV